MSPTIEPGDIIMVNKMSYGPRVVKLRKLFMEKKLVYKWHKGLGKPQKGDVFVFNWPNYFSLIESKPDFYGGFVVKRCFAASNNTVCIQNKRMKGNERMNNEGMKEIGGIGYDYTERSLLFPYDSTLDWTVNNFGPLWVPSRGRSISITPANAKRYKGMLLYEGNKIDIRNDSVFLNGKYTTSYTFKENYYFMLGDNFYNSMDSRYWGFVPEKSIVGKSVLVLFSLDPAEPWYRKFRWRRFLKRIK